MNQLTISDYGTSLGKRSERVSVRYRGVGAGEGGARPHGSRSDCHRFARG